MRAIFLDMMALVQTVGELGHRSENFDMAITLAHSMDRGIRSAVCIAMLTAEAILVCLNITMASFKMLA